jgi:hypothetical protein
MKTKIIPREISDLSSGAVQIAHAKMPASPAASPRRRSERIRRFVVQQARRAERFRESLRRRETAPFADVMPYHHWGLNE